MIPDLQSSLLCDDVRQERNGKFMLIGIFEGLAVPAERPVSPRICLVNRWCAGEGTFSVQSRFVGPDGTTVVAQGQPVPIDLKSDQQVETTVEAFLNIPFRQEGTHWVEVYLDHQMRMRYPLHVRIIRKPDATPPSPPAQGAKS